MALKIKTTFAKFFVHPLKEFQYLICHDYAKRNISTLMRKKKNSHSPPVNLASIGVFYHNSKNKEPPKKWYIYNSFIFHFFYQNEHDSSLWEIVWVFFFINAHSLVLYPMPKRTKDHCNHWSKGDVYTTNRWILKTEN